ncbi:hypothetical protein E2C01_060828 [Portunus trituberculatus]|uniref:Uncharacterized protein n=1 Tax=Portunus trituberculatus TaxID=210409 RepID=A0A5B7HBM3_PORTR|nr:hypothetical protein [Portunus trituberculatus]
MYRFTGHTISRLPYQWSQTPETPAKTWYYDPPLNTNHSQHLIIHSTSMGNGFVAPTSDDPVRTLTPNYSRLRGPAGNVAEKEKSEQGMKEDDKADK